MALLKTPYLPSISRLLYQTGEFAQCPTPQAPRRNDTRRGVSNRHDRGIPKAGPASGASIKFVALTPSDQKSSLRALRFRSQAHPLDWQLEREISIVMKRGHALIRCSCGEDDENRTMASQAERADGVDLKTQDQTFWLLSKWQAPRRSDRNNSRAPYPSRLPLQRIPPHKGF